MPFHFTIINIRGTIANRTNLLWKPWILSHFVYVTRFTSPSDSVPKKILPRLSKLSKKVQTPRFDRMQKSNNYTSVRTLYRPVAKYFVPYKNSQFNEILLFVGIQWCWTRFIQQNFLVQTWEGGGRKLFALYSFLFHDFFFLRPTS